MVTRVKRQPDLLAKWLGKGFFDAETQRRRENLITARPRFSLRLCVSASKKPCGLGVTSRPGGLPAPWPAHYGHALCRIPPIPPPSPPPPWRNRDRRANHARPKSVFATDPPLNGNPVHGRPRDPAVEQSSHRRSFRNRSQGRATDGLAEVPW